MYIIHASNFACALSHSPTMCSIQLVYMCVVTTCLPSTYYYMYVLYAIHIHVGVHAGIVYMYHNLILTCFFHLPLVSMSIPQTTAEHEYSVVDESMKRKKTSALVN